MNGLKRHVSPGAAVFLIVIVLAIVQWVWWRGLVYKSPTGSGPPPTSGSAIARPDLVLTGKKYVMVDTLSGALDPGDVDGPGYVARFDRPTGIALDRAGMLYVCDTGNHRIRVVAPNGSASTLAGSDQGFADGPAAQAKFNAPCGICVTPDGTLYVADTGNSKVRRIHGGEVTTIIQIKSSLNSAISPLPVAVEYSDETTPHLLVLDAASRSLGQYALDGTYLSGSTQSEPAVIQTDGANHSQDGKTSNLSIVGADALPDVDRRPAVRHLTGWCRIGSGALATDLAYGAVFYVKEGSADVLAGIVPAERPVRSWRDGNGEVALFCSATGVVTDGVKYAYVADTGNNSIRRLTLPDFMFK